MYYSFVLQASIYDEKDAPLVFDGPLPRVFMDVSIGGAEPRRIEFKLYANVTPKTAENFRCLCTGMRADSCIDYRRCDNSLRSKDRCCRKRGVQAGREPSRAISLE